MSWSNVIPYFRTHCDAAGFTEWRDAFNVENVPSSILDHRYHLTIGDIVGVSLNQQAQRTEVPVELRLFYKAFNDPAAGRDTALVEAQALVIECLEAANRAGSQIQNVLFDTMSVRALNTTNDNSIMVTIEFRCVVYLGTA